MTDAERKLWRHLRSLPIDKSHFRRQATIGAFYADFACHECKLVVEVDGGHHNEDAQRALDQARTDFLQAEGYRVLRFWNNDVLTNVEGVLEVIYAAMTEVAAPPTPDPSPPLASLAGGGET